MIGLFLGESLWGEFDEHGGSGAWFDSVNVKFFPHVFLVFPLVTYRIQLNLYSFLLLCILLLIWIFLILVLILFDGIEDEVLLLVFLFFGIENSFVE